jgi:hypothetical protein
VELAHGVEDAPLHGLQPVADIGQRPLRDRRERVSEIPLLQRLAEIDGLDVAATRRRNQMFGQGFGVPCGLEGFKANRE